MATWLRYCVFALAFISPACKKETAAPSETPNPGRSTQPAQIPNPGAAVKLAETPSSEDPATSYKEFVPRFLAAYSSKWGEYQYDVTYDLKKTDSALNPLVGVLTFKQNKDKVTADKQFSYTRCDLSFIREGGKWVANKATLTNHYNTSLGDGESTDATSFMNEVATSVQK